jgi:hypothetical protein
MPAALRAGAPIVLAGDCRRVEIAVGRAAAVLHVFGNTTYFDGFPIRGAAGDILARCIVSYDDGSTAVVPLRNGMELASASMIARHSRMNPIAVGAERVLILTIDPDFEIYQVNRLAVPTDRSKVLQKVVFETLSTEYYPLLYGITVEAPPSGA